MKRILKADKRYLWIPVSKEKSIEKIQIYVGEELTWSFQIPIDSDVNNIHYPVDYYAEIKIEKYAGKEITIEGEAVTELFLEAIKLSDLVPDPAEEHGCIHFTARNGWINDPAGLYYQNGFYHMYFQHNPFNTIWENMSWGHAVSKDLIHWEQKDTVLYPDQDGTVYTGCAILNEQEHLDLPKDIPFFFYTCAGGRNQWSEGKQFSQRLAYSLDGGDTLLRKEGIQIDFIVDENRDPKVYWHEQNKHYYMILFLTGYEYAIFVSKDLGHWEMTQRFTLDQCWECPDLRKIPDGKEGRWVFWSADGYYCLCDFDGRRITNFGEVRNIYRTSLPYAAQTFYDMKDRVVMIPWMRTESKHSSYTGMMGIPRELEIRIIEGKEVLVHKPVAEYYKDRKEMTLPLECKENAAVTVEIELDRKEKAVINIFGTSYGYDSCTGICHAGPQEIELEKDLSDITFLVDKELVEISACHDTIYAALETESIIQKGSVSIEEKSNGTNIKVYIS